MDGDFDLDIGGGDLSTTGADTSTVGTGEDAPLTQPEPPVQVDYNFNDDDLDDIVEPVQETAPVTDAPADVTTDPVTGPAATDAASGQSQDFFAPLFQPIDESFTGLDRELKQVEIAGGTLERLKTYDRTAHTALLNAGYNQNQETIAQWVLEDLGVPADKIDTFLEWAKKGATDLPGAIDVPTGFPVADEFGIVTLADGLELDLSEDGDPAHRLLYETEKARFEAAQRAERETAEQQSREQQRRIQESYTGFGNERVQAYDRDVAELKLDFGQGNEWMKDALLAYADTLIGQDKQIAALLKEVNPLIESGSARAKELGLEMDRLAKAHLQTAANQFTNYAARSNQAQRAAAAGHPKLPAGTQQIQAGTRLANAKTPTSMKQVEEDLAAELDLILK